MQVCVDQVEEEVDEEIEEGVFYFYLKVVLISLAFLSLFISSSDEVYTVKPIEHSSELNRLGVHDVVQGEKKEGVTVAGNLDHSAVVSVKNSGCICSPCLVL